MRSKCGRKIKKMHRIQLFNKIIVFVVLFTAFSVVFSSHVNVTNAATLSLSPLVSNVSTGNIVSMKVLVGTEGKAINNVDAIIRFPVDLLEVVSVSKSSSIFSLWVEEPKFSNYDGTITLNGGLPNPGYNGPAGDIVSMVFRTKKQGNATVVFGDSAVRQNDGLGTDILTSKQFATINIEATRTEIPPVPTVTSSLPAKPLIISSTHPDQDIWYSVTTASFNWNVPEDITSVQTLLSMKQNAMPDVTYDASVSQRTVSNLSDGILYFNVRYFNSIGWGPVASYRIQIDSTPPDKFILSVRNQGMVNVVMLNAHDAMSGIDSYLIQINDKKAFRVKNGELVEHEYVLPVQNKGEHTLKVLAYDKSGNYIEAHSIFTSVDIVSPIIKSADDQIARGDVLTVLGKSKYSNTPVEVYIKTADENIKTYLSKTDQNGNFSVTSEENKISGTLEVTSKLVFSSSTVSQLSNKLVIHVMDTLIVRTSQSVIHTLIFIVPAIFLILLVLFALYYGWHKFFGLKKQINREVQSTAIEIHKALTLFKEELGDQLDKLKKIKEDRELNEKEEKIFKDLQVNINNIDDFIEKKIKKLSNKLG